MIYHCCVRIVRSFASFSHHSTRLLTMQPLSNEFALVQLLELIARYRIELEIEETSCSKNALVRKRSEL